MYAEQIGPNEFRNCWDERIATHYWADGKFLPLPQRKPRLYTPINCTTAGPVFICEGVMDMLRIQDVMPHAICFVPGNKSNSKRLARKAAYRAIFKIRHSKRLRGFGRPKYAIYLWYGQMTDGELEWMPGFKEQIDPDDGTVPEGWCLYRAGMRLAQAVRELRSVLQSKLYDRPTVLFVKHTQIPTSQLQNGEPPEYLTEWVTTGSIHRD